MLLCGNYQGLIKSFSKIVYAKLVPLDNDIRLQDMHMK